MIGAIGTADKPALLIGIVVVAGLIGAATGKAALQRRWVGDVVFAVFALLGALAGIRDPLASNAGAIVAAVVGGLAGAFTLRLLLTAAGQWALPSGQGSIDEAGRRQFLLVAGALGTLAAIVGLGGRSLARRFNVEAARDEVVLPTVSVLVVRPMVCGLVVAAVSLNVSVFVPPSGVRLIDAGKGVAPVLEGAVTM